MFFVWGKDFLYRWYTRPAVLNSNLDLAIKITDSTKSTSLLTYLFAKSLSINVAR